MSGITDWNVGVNVADAACRTKISTYTCHACPTNGNDTATNNRTRSAPTMTARRGNLAKAAAANGATKT